MSYRLTFPGQREAEPYTGLEDEEDVYAAIKEEAEKIVNDLGSLILNDGSEEEREKVTVQLAVEIKENLWTQRVDLEGVTSYKVKVGRYSVVFGLEEENN